MKQKHKNSFWEIPKNIWKEVMVFRCKSSFRLNESEINETKKKKNTEIFADSLKTRFIHLWMFSDWMKSLEYLLRLNKKEIHFLDVKKHEIHQFLTEWRDLMVQNTWTTPTNKKKFHFNSFLELLRYQKTSLFNEEDEESQVLLKLKIE